MVGLEQERSKLHYAWAICARGCQAEGEVILVDKQSADENKRNHPTNTVK
jgi:hypothetical protein